MEKSHLEYFAILLSSRGKEKAHSIPSASLPHAPNKSTLLLPPCHSWHHQTGMGNIEIATHFSRVVSVNKIRITNQEGSLL